MKSLLFTCGCLLLPILSPDLSAQLLSQFSWDNSTDPTVADVGPNAVSINEFATVKLRTDGNTNGLAPGANVNKFDLDLVLADSSIFNVPGLDISFDYRRDESQGTILRRGDFIFGLADGLSVTYAVEDGAGGFTTVQSTKTVVTRDNGQFYNYRFIYDSATGNGRLLLDGVQVWENSPKTPGQALFWGSGGDIVVGTQIDASGTGNAVLDNFGFTQIGGVLPVELTAFSAVPDGEVVRIDWETSAETDNEVYLVERSTDFEAWTTVATLPGAGDATETNNYSAVDWQPVAGTAYYRLKQVDFGGAFTYSQIVEVAFAENDAWSLEVFPNPAGEEIRVTGLSKGVNQLGVYDRLGRDVTASVSFRRQGGGGLTADLGSLRPGVYFLRADERMVRLVKQ